MSQPETSSEGELLFSAAGEARAQTTPEPELCDIAPNAIVRPTLANLLSPSSHTADPVPLVSRPQLPGLSLKVPKLGTHFATPLTHHNPDDPTVLAMGISFPHSPDPAPTPSGSTRKAPARKPTAGAIGVLTTTEPLQMTRAHLAAYRLIQLRRPSPATPAASGSTGKKARKLCMAEAAWWYWAEKGGRWNGGKGGKRGKKGDKEKDNAGQASAAGVEVDDVIWGVSGRACNAYSYDENGDPYRPTMSMLEILRLVLAASMEKMLSLPDIYKAVEARWPYYKTCPDTWKGSIRNNLSVHECFQQLSREDEQGRPLKGWWKVEEDITTSLYPRQKDKDRNRKSLNIPKPLLSTDIQPHPLHPSFAKIDPDFDSTPTAGPSSRKRPRVDPESEIPVQRDPQGRRYKYQVVRIPGKTPDYPLPGIPPHPAGVVPPGYPNPLPPGWKYGWGDPTLVDLGKRYGGQIREDTAAEGTQAELIEGIALADGASSLLSHIPPRESAPDLFSYSALSYLTPTPSIHSITPPIHSNTPGAGGQLFSFAPLGEFSTYLTSPYPDSVANSQFGHRQSRSVSATSSRSSTSSAQTSLPLHLPFLNLLDPHPAPMIPTSSYPSALPVHPVDLLGADAVLARLVTRGPGFVPSEARGKWRSRIREMEPFPGSGDWVDLQAVRPAGGVGVASTSYASEDGVWPGEGVQIGRRDDCLPGIDAILGSRVKIEDPRLSGFSTVQPGRRC